MGKKKLLLPKPNTGEKAGNFTDNNNNLHSSPWLFHFKKAPKKFFRENESLTDCMVSRTNDKSM